MKNRNPKIYVVCGKARAGKDTSVGIIENYCKEKNLKILNLQFSSYLKEYAKKITGWDGSDDTKPRELLQTLGTSIIREQIDEKFFVSRMIGDIKVYSYFYDVITISDARLKIEVNSLKEEFENICAIQITRPNYDNGLTEEQKQHRTEVDLDDYDKFDYKIINDGSIKDLENKILEVINNES